MLGEEDQLEYMVHLSQKEAFKFDSTIIDIVDEDEDLKTALDASMQEIGSGSEQCQQVTQMENSRTPSRKRGYRELTLEDDCVGVAGDNHGHPSSRLDQGRYEKLTSYANAVKGTSPSYNYGN